MMILNVSNTIWCNNGLGYTLTVTHDSSWKRDRNGANFFFYLTRFSKAAMTVTVRWAGGGGGGGGWWWWWGGGGGILMCMRSANEGQRYSITPSLIGWAFTQNDPCWGQNKWATFCRQHLQKYFRMKMKQLRLKYHWILLLWVRLTRSHRDHFGYAPNQWETVLH